MSNTTTIYEPTPTSTRATWLYGIYLAAYMIAWPFFRSLGVAPFILLLMVAMLPMLTARRTPIILSLATLSGLSVIYIGLSYAHVLPAAWTIFYDSATIPQQAMGNLFMPLLVGANICLLWEIAQLPPKARLSIYVTFCAGAIFLTSIFLLLYSTEETAFGDQEGTGFLFLVQNNVLFSSEFISVIIVSALAFRLPLIWGLAVIVVNLVLSVNFQPALAFLLAIPCRLGWIGRRQTIAIAIAMFAASLISTFYGQEILAFDPNSAIRTAFWKDALASLWQAHGVGIGYGTEAIRGSYFFGNDERWVARETDEGFMYVGVHSSLFQTLLRLGPLGFVLLAIVLYRLVPAQRDGSRYEYWLYLVMVLNMAVNVAMESLNFMLGLAMVMAILFTRYARANVADAPTKINDVEPVFPADKSAVAVQT